MSNLTSPIVPAHLRKMFFSFDNPVAENSRVLEKGKIKLTVGNSNLLFQATSGLAGFQSLSSSSKRGKGRIPTCSQAQISSYFVKTTPIYLPNVKGVNGNFYPITPFAVSVAGFPRSDLGIHRDTNVPGSSGCIVIALSDHWKSFEIQMKKLAFEGVEQIMLIVN